MTTSNLTLEERRLFSRAARRIIPLMILLYTVSFLDRVNVGFAALTMNADLGFTPEIFGWGVGIFFIGYFIFEVPSNVVIEKVGARLWICRIMVTWGLISGAMAFVSTPMSFYILRFLLGAAEAGFAPGMILYLTYWFPADLRAKLYGTYFIAIPLASVIGAPVSSWLLGFDGHFGFKGWQWMFIIEAVPALLLGLAVLWFLPDNPAKARWLSGDERARIADCLARDRATSHVDAMHTLWPALKDARVLLMCGIYFSIVIGLYGISFWLPQMVKQMGFTNIEVGWIVAAVYAVAAVAMPLWGWSSDRARERIWHTAISCLVGAAGFIGGAYFQSPLLVILSLGLAAIGTYVSIVPFWAVPPIFLGGTAAAGGIALINATGNLGGFVGPYIVGWVKNTTQSYTAGILALAVALAAAAGLILMMRILLARATLRANSTAG
ncbi:MFS transporter [Parvibaculum sp.]|uniref:MFS transporter n=1 Tax=Parvibaculum sp. TaxID=2024848 RepID=UPI0025F761D6|nr:MFS transporter [Parvibaculum sp.]